MGMLLRRHYQTDHANNLLTKADALEAPDPNVEAQANTAVDTAAPEWRKEEMSARLSAVKAAISARKAVEQQSPGIDLSKAKAGDLKDIAEDLGLDLEQLGFDIKDEELVRKAIEVTINTGVVPLPQAIATIRQNAPLHAESESQTKLPEYMPDAIIVHDTARGTAEHYPNAKPGAPIVSRVDGSAADISNVPQSQVLVPDAEKREIDPKTLPVVDTSRRDERTMPEVPPSRPNDEKLQREGEASPRTDIPGQTLDQIRKVEDIHGVPESTSRLQETTLTPMKAEEPKKATPEKKGVGRGNYTRQAKDK
jgi:hypothetical protein